MTKDYFSSEVCEQLARELVTEQAELLRHNVLVNEIKEKLYEGKKQLIRKLIQGKPFLINGKKRTALSVGFAELQDLLRVRVTFGEDPNDVKLPPKMTRREKDLFWEYTDYMLFFKDELDDWAGKEALVRSGALSMLKNHICVTFPEFWVIDFSNATTPGFFGQSGLEIHTKDGCYMLEDMVVY